MFDVHVLPRNSYLSCKWEILVVKPFEHVEDGLTYIYCKCTLGWLKIFS